jgi:hypothetical protein
MIERVTARTVKGDTQDIPRTRRPITYIKCSRVRSQPTPRCKRSGILPWKQLAANVTRRRGKARTIGFTPSRAVDFPLIANLQSANRFVGREDRIAHSATRVAVYRSNFLPEFEPPHLEFRQLLSELAPKTVLRGFASAFTTPGKHPEPVSPPPDEQNAPVF